MKTCLILVLSSEIHPYPKMIQTALNTWDSIEVEGCETIYYCGDTGKPNQGKIIYLPVQDRLETMGEKTIQAFEWALNNKKFDFIARVHSSCFVDKKKLMEHIQNIPSNYLFSGIQATSQNGFQFLWGGGHYVISRDVVQAIVDNRSKWKHNYMEDESMSLVVSELGIPFHDGKSCSINKTTGGWLCLGYGGQSKEITVLSELKDIDQFFFRVKQDGNRDLDEVIMNELFNNLK